MNCLILAAGHGSRLRGVSESKPLTPVAGRPLIAHVIEAAMAAGANDFTVVTGHRAEQVGSFLAERARALDVRMAFVRLDDWNRPNGHSVMAGAASIAGDYLLLMSDHLFDPEIARRAKAGGGALTLAVDRDWRRESLDLDDATKVALDGDRIAAIGKTLSTFDAVDTGVFHASPKLAEAIAAAVADGKPGSLSDGVQRLAAAGQARVADVTGLFWLDVDDPVALAKAEAHFARP